MPVIVDQSMREQIPREGDDFPLSFFENELGELPNREGPLHWHPEFEIAKAETGVLEYQVGQTHIVLKAGDSVMVNRNLLHSVRQIAGERPDPMPVVVFSGTLIAPETGTIYQKYIAPIADCESLPFVVFRQKEDWCRNICCLVDELFANLKQREPCYEMAVQRDLSCLFEALYRHWDALPRSQATGMQLRSQVRVQKISDVLGKETIDSYNQSENRGAQTSHGLNYQKLGKDKTGLRISEFVGLTLADVDLKNRKLVVDHQLQRKRNMEYVIEDTKTTCGTREIPMTEDVYECFQRIIQNRTKPQSEPMIGGKCGFLYLDKNGMPMVALHWEKYFQHICQKYNSIYKVQMPKVTPHVCRHTFCSNMAKSGMNPKTLQYLMGHSDIGVTLNTYTHLGYDDAKEELKRVANGE